MASRWSGMTTLKCSRCTMLPTTCASRSNCLSFSGAFMALVYSPDALCEIGVVGGHLARHRPAQQLELPGRGGRRAGHRRRRVIAEPGLVPDVLAAVDRK